MILFVRTNLVVHKSRLAFSNKTTLLSTFKFEFTRVYSGLHILVLAVVSKAFVKLVNQNRSQLFRVKFQKTHFGFHVLEQIGRIRFVLVKELFPIRHYTTHLKISLQLLQPRIRFVILLAVKVPKPHSKHTSSRTRILHKGLQPVDSPNK